jgi:single-strand DNA-binding protein
MNSVNLVGRITKPLELKSTASNISVVSFTLAVNRQFTSESGEREADFIQCVVWRKQAENLAQYCDKGSLVGLTGRLQTRQYDTDNGTKYITEVVVDNVEFLESKKEDKKEEVVIPTVTSKVFVPSAVEEELPF